MFQYGTQWNGGTCNREGGREGWDLAIKMYEWKYLVIKRNIAYVVSSHFTRAIFGPIAENILPFFSFYPVQRKHCKHASNAWRKVIPK